MKAIKKKRNIFTVRVAKDVREKLEILAEGSRRDMGNYVEMLILEAYDAKKKSR